MPAKFKTLGPFELKVENGQLDKTTLRAIWKGNKGLRYGIGVYILTVQVGKRLIPIYVGKTNRSFGSRLGQHSIFSKVSDSFEGKKLLLFLIPRVTSKKGDLVRAKRKFIENGEGIRSQVKGLKSIDQLEFALIGTCIAQNENLLNKQEKTFHQGLIVPGYLNDESEELTESSSKLKRMLTNKG